MAQILKGAPVVAAMNEANAARCAALKEKGIVPTLAVVRVGAREDDISYEKGIVTRCGKVGVEVRQFHLAEDVTQEELLDVIRQINGDASVHGCLIFRPLPKRFDDRRVQEALAPEKDVDGITDGSMAGVFTNMPIGYPPCTAQACLEILKYYNVPLSGKRAVVVGRSLVVGQARCHDAGSGKRHRDPLQFPHPGPARPLPGGGCTGGRHGQAGSHRGRLPAGRSGRGGCGHPRQ